MQALRLARSAATPLRSTTSAALTRRCLATATANPVEVVSSSTSATAAPVPLSNIEALWGKLTPEEKQTVHEQLETIQQKDWKELSLEEKKAAYYVAFGPHGPRTPVSQPGDNLKIFAITAALVGVAGAIYLGIKSISPAPPKTMTREWQEASNERALEAKIEPMTGISSEGYKGKGFVQSK
ncbi:cytochrome c oxidase subunit IV-domain-containing protein [Gymnopilus junonius]|uniref:Cytochrome c oxidase subunit IV-domain-containing protein n=1 Tax=Gymnopilus junonius TaxID=109634 RepID=A0A9P5NS75_GYMJU|nr:cytochrome c oxidase subunit IV-domain-containing protein [Gymnopilus junonius]